MLRNTYLMIRTKKRCAKFDEMQHQTTSLFIKIEKKSLGVIGKKVNSTVFYSVKRNKTSSFAPFASIGSLSYAYEVTCMEFRF